MNSKKKIREFVLLEKLTPRKMHNRRRPKREKEVIDHSTGDKNQNHDIVYLRYNLFSYNSK